MSYETYVPHHTRVLLHDGMSRRFYPVSETNYRRHGFRYGFILITSSMHIRVVFGFGQNGQPFVPLETRTHVVH